MPPFNNMHAHYEPVQTCFRHAFALYHGHRAAPLSGSSVGLSSKGLTLAIGGPGDNNRVGAVWIFTSTDGVNYQEEAKLVGTGNNGASKQGTSLSLSADGQWLYRSGCESIVSLCVFVHL